MSNPTTPFGWQMPTATDLVTDLPADFEVFGQAVATSMADLLGGTTGQVLAKASATDMDFTWIANDQGDITGVTAGTGISGGGTSGTVTITNAIATTMTTKGDLVPATGSGTFARLAVGADGTTIVADASTATGLRYQGSQAAGKNAVINGAFDIWQRGTSFSVGNGWTYTADRWQSTEGAGTWTLARESSVVPLGSQYSLKLTSGGTTSGQIATLIETANVTQFQGKTITISAQVAASTSIPMAISLYYSTTADDNITNTSTAISATTGGTATPTSTTFVTLTGTYAIPSTAKTLQLRINSTGNMTSTQAFYVGQVQLELGSVATAFTRAGGTIQGELAACQRYYFRTSPTASGLPVAANGGTVTTTIGQVYTPLPVAMRVNPFAMEFSAINWYNFGNNTEYNTGTFTMTAATPNFVSVRYTHGSAIFTAGQTGAFVTAGATSYLGFTAEL